MAIIKVIVNQKYLNTIFFLKFNRPLSISIASVVA